MQTKRNAGVLLPVFSLPGDFGIGTIGREAYRFVDLLAAAGFSLWQVLPLCLPDECHSPYKSFGAFSLNPLFIDLELLREEGLLTPAEVEDEKQRSPYLCEYDRLAETRLSALRLAYGRYRDGGALDAFLGAHPHTADVCRFMALKAANGGAPCQAFTVKNYAQDEFRFWAFLQMKAYNQWQNLHAYAKKHGVSLVGDMPIYVAEDSADVYFSPENFRLDPHGYPREVAGVPPDYFSAEGQLWGNPLYDFPAMKKDGFAFWRARAAFMGELFDAVRIDHFRAFASYFAIPKGKTAKDGKFKRGPGMALIRAIRAAAPDTLFIAEDLGDITDDVKKLVRDSGFPCMRVFQFGFLGDDASIHRPHAVPENAFYYSGTHDNNTLLGFVFEMPENTRRDLFRYCGFSGGDWNTPAGYNAIFSALLGSHARSVVLPAQDLFLFGADTRVNTPGRAEGNWAYRLTRAQLDNLDTAAWRYTLSLYDR